MAGTVMANSVEEEASMKAESGLPIVAERPMYFGCSGKWTGGHVAAGFSPR